jgi:hypothetical protein
MTPPGHKKNRVIQIDVTDRCDLKCSNCTRMLAHHPKRYDMTPSVFRETCRILNRALPYFIFGVFGGNPTLSPHFDELCAIMREEIPQQWRRGIWCNHPRGRGQTIKDTFGYFNLNAHNVPDAVAEFEKFGLPVIPESKRSQSWHAPTLVAIKDFIGTPQIPDEAAMWRTIETCDIDQNWSGAVIEIDGKPMLYSCEIHAAFDLMYGENNGVLLTDESAVAHLATFEHQYKRWCPECGISLRLKGQKDLADTDDVSKSHLPLVQLRVRRKHQLHDTLDIAHCGEATDYVRRRTAEEVTA